MPDLPGFVWCFFWAGPPIVAAVGAGVWLLRRGDRLAGVLFCAWAVTRVLITLLRYYINSYWLLEPGRTAGEQIRASVATASLANGTTATLLGCLIVTVLFRREAAR